METNLRPLSLGEILDRTAQLYRTNFIPFAGISAVYAGVLLVLNLIQIGVAELLRAHHLTQQAQLVPLYSVVLILPMTFIFGGAAMAANNRAVAWVNMGQPATIRGAYLSILPRLGRYLWLMTIATAVCYFPFVVIYGALFLMILLTKGVFAHPGAGADPYAGVLVGIAAIGLLLLSFPAAIYAIIMALRYSLAVPAAVVEDLKARPALRRSIELSRGSRGRIFVLGLLIVVIQLGLVLFSQAIFFVMAFKQHGQFPPWVQVVQHIVGFFTNSFIGPMYATGLTLFYYDQRIRKEGFDIEWMMQAAGLTVPPPEQVQEQSAAPESGGFTPDPDRQELRMVLAPKESAPEDSIPPESPTEPGQPFAPPAAGTQHE